MRRRVFLGSLGLVMVGGSLSAEAQRRAEIARIGRLSPISASADAPVLEGLRQGLRDLGWVEGQNFAIENRFAEGNVRRLAELAAELVRLKVDVIVTGSAPAAAAAKNATATIPIVMVMTGDPVASGLVASLSRPGGNLTGLTLLGLELSAKRLALLKEAVPAATRVAVLLDPTFSDSEAAVKRMEGAAQALGVQLRIQEVRDPSEFEKIFATMSSDRIGALMVQTDPILYTYRRRIVELVAKSRLPAMYSLREYMDAGGLMFYGSNLPDMHRRAATYVDKVLKGARPGDLPIEQATNFELVINLRTAKALGLTMPSSLLNRADRVIDR
jgi:putative ABC transport system substrate-binding protein